MSDVGQFLIGATLTAAGIVATVFGQGQIGAALISLGVGQIASSLRADERQKGVERNVSVTTASLPVVYGKAKVGAKIFETRIDPNFREDLYRGLAFCLGGEDGSGIEGIEKVWFNDISAIAPVVEDNSANGVTTNIASKWTTDGNLRYNFQDGADGQSTPGMLNDIFPSVWDADHKGVGIAHMVMKMVFDRDVWGTGIPKVTALVKGVKCYDPRDSTWKWTTNPVLHVLDYLTSDRYGKGANYKARDGGTAPEEIDEQTFIDAANFADENVTINIGGSNEIKTRFEANGFVDSGQDPDRNLEALLSGCRGNLVYQDGKWRIYIRKGSATVESFVLDESNTVGEWTWKRAGSGEAPNRITATYIDEDQDYSPNEVTWPEVGDTTLLDQDGGFRSEMEASLPLTTKASTAKQIAQVLLREVRQDVTIEVTADESALQLQIGDLIKVSHESPGWDEKQFWVVGWSLNPDFTVDLSLREFDANAYSLSDQQAPDAFPGTELPDPTEIDAPTNLVLTADATTSVDTQDGQRVPAIEVQWTAPDDPFLDRYIVRYKKTSEANFKVAPDPVDVDTEAVIFPVTNGEDYDVEVIAVNTLGIHSSALTGQVTVSTKAGDDFRLALDDFREVARDTNSVTYQWAPGADVDSIWIYRNQVDQPTAADPWPSGVADLIDVVDASTTQYQFDLPPQGKAAYIQIEPLDESSVEGPVRRIILLPLSDEPDRVQGLEVIVDDEDGSVQVNVEASDLAGSYRYAFNVGAAPSWPSEADVESGTVRTISSQDSFTLAAGTVALGQKIRLRVVGYVNADGTGADGATDHGIVVGAEDVRTKFRVPKLEITSESESGSTGSMTVKVIDPDDLADDLYVRTKSGADSWGAWTLVASDPADASTHSQNVTLKEKHQSFVQFRLDSTLGGEPSRDVVTSGGLDRGQIPDGSIIPRIDETSGAASASLIGDIDTAQWKVFASTTEADITAANVDAQTAIAGRVLTPSDVGTLLTLDLGQTVYYGARAIGPNGEEQSAIIKGEAVFKEIAPTLKVTTETESGGTGTFGVTLDDPGGQADLLEYRTKSGDGSWSSWSTKANPPADGTEYSETVALIDVHPSFVEFRLTFTLAGKTQIVHAKSSGFDNGKVPDGTAVAVIQENGDGSAVLKGDFDTTKWKVLGSTSSYPTLASVQAETAISGRILTPADVGTLATVAGGETLYVSALPIASDGTEGPLVKVEADREKPFQAPQISFDADQSGGSATVDVTVHDPELAVTALEFQKKTGAGGFSGTWVSTWDSSTGTPGTDDPLTRSEGISLDGKHNVGLKVRVTYTDSEGNSDQVIAVWTGDVDEIPHVQIQGVGKDPSDDSALIGLVGDEDTADIRVTWSIGANPSEPSDPLGTDTALGSRSGVLDTGATVSPGDTVWVKALGEDSGGTLAPNSEIAEAKFVVSEGGLTPQFKSEVDYDFDNNVGKFDLTITDPQKRVTAVEFATKTGGGSPGFTAFGTGWDRSTGIAGTDETLTRGEDIALHEKRNNILKFRITYDDVTGTSQQIEFPVVFDVDRTPEIHRLAIFYQSDGRVGIRAEGDDDCDVIRGNVRTDGVRPGVSPGSGDFFISGTSGFDTSSTVAQMGDDVVVTVWGEYTDSGGGLHTGAGFTDIDTRGGAETTKPRFHYRGFRSGNSVTFSLDVDDPTLALDSVQYRVKTEDGTASGWTTWSPTSGSTGGSTAPTYDHTVTINPGRDSQFEWRATWTDENGTSRTVSAAPAQLSNMEDGSGSFTVAHGGMRLSDTSVGGMQTIDGSTTYEGVGPADLNETNLVGILEIPPGVEITGLEATLKRSASADVAKAFLAENTGSGKTLHDVRDGPTTSGWGTASVTFGTTISVGDDPFFVSVRLEADSTATDVGFGRYKVEYSRPTFDKVL